MCEETDAAGLSCKKDGGSSIKDDRPRDKHQIFLERVKTSKK
jgi:hypothetical protein